MLTALIAFALVHIDFAEPQDQAAKEQRYIRSRQFQLKDLQVEELKVGVKQEHKFKTWVMDTDAKRQEGMMFLLNEDVADDQAMIFVFDKAETLSFWMKNTYIPLDIAYIDTNGKIVKTYTMQALDVYTDYTSKLPAKYALEMKKGTMLKLGILVGQKVEIPEKVKAKE